GTVMTVDEALEAMITISDNGTALALWHSLGPDNINTTLRTLGLADFHIANDDNDDNTATARVIGQYFTLLAQRKLVSPPVTAPSYDAGSVQALPIQVTNSGAKAWPASGAGSVKLIWEVRDAAKALVSSSPAPIPLPALAPAAPATVTIAFTAPAVVGDYTMTVGLADVNGNALATVGAAIGSF